MGTNVAWPHAQVVSHRRSEIRRGSGGEKRPGLTGKGQLSKLSGRHGPRAAPNRRDVYGIGEDQDTCPGLSEGDTLSSRESRTHGAEENPTCFGNSDSRLSAEEEERPYRPLGNQERPSSNWKPSCLSPGLSPTREGPLGLSLT